MSGVGADPARALAGGVLDEGSTDDSTDLRRLVDELGQKSFEARRGVRSRPESLDADLWRHLEDTGLSRLTSTPRLDAGPVEAAITLRGLAAHACAVPIAETDVMAGWLGAAAQLEVPPGPLAVAIVQPDAATHVTGPALDVPWAQAAAAILVAICGEEGVRVGVLDAPHIESGHNLAGEPRDRVTFDLASTAVRSLPPDFGAELLRRGAWARCCQIVGALDAAAELSVSHTRERIQFGRPLHAFQTVQHSLTEMAGEIERGRAATSLAVAAAADYGFGARQTDSAVTVAKVTLGQVVRTVSTVAHQLHGAIGVTAEHPLWMFTMRARSWIQEYGSAGSHARKLGRATLAATDPWDAIRSLSF